MCPQVESGTVSEVGATPLVERIDARPRLVEELTTRLRDLILSNDLAPGTRLVQSTLAEQFGVSRTPLREALRALERDGLVRVVGVNRTVEVVTLDGDELRQMYEFRGVIDGLAARLLARRGMTPDVEKRLDHAVDQMAASMRPFAGERFFVYHLDFHSAIVEHCGNDRLVASLNLVRSTAGSLRTDFARVVRRGLSGETPDVIIDRVLSGHRCIVDAIRSRDEARAEALARAHIDRALVEYLGDDDVLAT